MIMLTIFQGKLCFKPIESPKDTLEFHWGITSQSDENDGVNMPPRRLVSRIESLVCVPDPSHPPPTLEWMANLDNVVAMGPSKLEYLELSFYRNSLKSMSDRSMYVNSILEMRLMGFVAIRFTLDGEHVSHSALRGMFLY